MHQLAEPNEQFTSLLPNAEAGAQSWPRGGVWLPFSKGTLSAEPAMSTPSDLAPFQVETSYDTREVRAKPTRPRSKIGVTEDQLFVIFGAMGVACLFWRYTLALGAATLAVTVFLWAMRRRSVALRKLYEPLEEPGE